MRNTKKLTLSAILTALGAAVMIIGGVVEVLDLTVCAFASIVMVFVYLEIGTPYTFLVWVCTTLSTALMFPGSVVWVEYLLVFGIYPIIKAYIERLPRTVWLVVKLVYINAVVLALIFIVEGIFSVPFFEDTGLVMKVITYVLINVAFVAYDMFITVMVRVYMEKIRPRISRFLK